MKHIFYLGIILTIIFQSCQPDTKYDRYDQWDANQNSGIDDQEFEQSFTTSPYYDQWNSDDNRAVSREEFTQGFFRMIDKDGDGTLSSSEWQQGKEAYFSDATVDTPTLNDSDQTLQSAEFNELLEEVNYYDQWDENSNGSLEEPEVAQGVFAMWDTDGNGVIEANEYEVWDNEP